jgi:NADH:ubiquinone oxidoreductase subunit 5 (subunit L)/multisubunit Na+/H+ antiporter MnhA subunit
MPLAAAITIIASSVLVTILSIYLLTGRGSFLIAGFNTMSKEKRAKYNEKALCKFIGGIALPTGLLMPFFLIESIIDWYAWVYCGIVLVLCVFAIIYANTGNRFKK